MIPEPDDLGLNLLCQSNSRQINYTYHAWSQFPHLEYRNDSNCTYLIDVWVHNSLIVIRLIQFS